MSFLFEDLNNLFAAFFNLLNPYLLTFITNHQLHNGKFIVMFWLIKHLSTQLANKLYEK